MRHRRARHSGGPLGCLHAVVGFAACVGFIVGAWHIATDPAGASVEPSSAIVEPARVEPTMRPTVKPTREPTARPVKPQTAVKPIDCADEEDPDLCVELGDEYIP